MKKLSKEELDEIIKSKKSIFLKKELDKLSTGEALEILRTEWTVNTQPRTYYGYHKHKMEYTIRVKNIGEYYYLIKE